LKFILSKKDVGVAFAVSRSFLRASLQSDERPASESLTACEAYIPTEYTCKHCEYSIQFLYYDSTDDINRLHLYGALLTNSNANNFSVLNAGLESDAGRWVGHGMSHSGNNEETNSKSVHHCRFQCDFMFVFLGMYSVNNTLI
jgi:hypothetical protein